MLPRRVGRQVRRHPALARDAQQIQLQRAPFARGHPALSTGGVLAHQPPGVSGTCLECQAGGQTLAASCAVGDAPTGLWTGRPRPERRETIRAVDPIAPGPVLGRQESARRAAPAAGPGNCPAGAVAVSGARFGRCRGPGSRSATASEPDLATLGIEDRQQELVPPISAQF
jgi:hypothetical protein